MLAVIWGERIFDSPRPIETASSMEMAEQLAIIRTDLNGITIFRKPYVKPTLKLSRLSAKASKSKEKIASLDRAPPCQITTIVYGWSLSIVIGNFCDVHYRHLNSKRHFIAETRSPFNLNDKLITVSSKNRFYKFNGRFIM